MPPTAPPRPGDPLRVAFLIYRGNPHCGGQGVYSRHVSRELTNLGHEVTVFAGQPWPVVDDPVKLEKVSGLDLYRRENPFRTPWPYRLGLIPPHTAPTCFWFPSFNGTRTEIVPGV